MKLRTINQIIDLIKKDDPDTAVTVYLIRQLAKNGQVKCFLTGKKYLIDYVSVKDFLGINKGA